MRKNGRNSFCFGAWTDNPGKNKLGDHIINAELEAHLGSQDVYDIPDIQFFSRCVEEKMTEVVFLMGSKSTEAGLFCVRSSTVCIFFGDR